MKWLAIIALWAYASASAAVSNAPLQAIYAYIEHSSKCAEDVVNWNRLYGARAISGETSRNFYYRALALRDWGQCGQPFIRPILGELQKIWGIFAKDLVTEAEFETKEAELINLLFAALEDEKRGRQMIQQYEATTAGRLMEMEPPRQYFNCTFFGAQVRCVE